MGLKDIWSKTNKWILSKEDSASTDFPPEIDNDGLISQQGETQENNQDQQYSQQNPDNQSPVVVTKTETPERSESIEKLHKGFDQLIEQLQGINSHLNEQAKQQQLLMERIEQLPELLENFPSIIDSQKQITNQLLDQVKANTLKTQQFVDAVEKIPSETGKQTDALVNIDHQLAAAADADVQMAQCFGRFHETLDKLNKNTAANKEALETMSRTFVTSDRYTKYLMSRQQRRFIWVFVTAMAICFAAAVILVGVIIWLKK